MRFINGISDPVEFPVALFEIKFLQDGSEYKIKHKKDQEKRKQL
jgi:hypothetical protein